jgi:hypothetical protein
MMSTVQLNETNTNEEYLNSREEQCQRYPSGGEKQFHFANSNERLDNIHYFFIEIVDDLFLNRSGKNSRTNSLAESTTTSPALINNEGFSNFGEIIQHLQTGLEEFFIENEYFTSC